MEQNWGKDRKCLCIVNEKNRRQDNNGLVHESLKGTVQREKIIDREGRLNIPSEYLKTSKVS